MSESASTDRGLGRSKSAGDRALDEPSGIHRWQIELFFKAIKQTLKIKTFVGTSKNAVQIQIWTALICMLVLKLLQLRSSFGWSVSNLAAMLRMNLLTYRELWRWLNDPFDTPVAEPVYEQLKLF